ncbi:MAG: hypothetical protein QXT53_06770 [Ignisphaera sp.]
MSIRYIPVSINSIENIKGNLSSMPVNISLKTTAFVRSPTSSSSLYTLSNFPIEYILLFIGFALIFIITLLYTKSWYREESNVLVQFGEKEYYEEMCKIEYSYYGLKRILRNYFVNFRNRIRCPYCTPRETLSKLSFLKRFVDVYEDVVYGDKQRADVETVIDEVKNIEK